MMRHTPAHSPTQKKQKNSSRGKSFVKKNAHVLITTSESPSDILVCEEQDTTGLFQGQTQEGRGRIGSGTREGLTGFSCMPASVLNGGSESTLVRRAVTGIDSPGKRVLLQENHAIVVSSVGILPVYV